MDNRSIGKTIKRLRDRKAWTQGHLNLKMFMVSDATSLKIAKVIIGGFVH